MAETFGRISVGRGAERKVTGRGRLESGGRKRQYGLGGIDAGKVQALYWLGRAFALRTSMYSDRRDVGTFQGVLELERAFGQRSF